MKHLLWIFLVGAVAIAGMIGCENSDSSPVLAGLSRSPSSTILGVQDNLIDAKAAVLINAGDKWQRISLPARRFVPFSSAIWFEHSVILGRRDGLIFKVDDVNTKPRVKKANIGVVGPIVLLQQIEKTAWLVVGQTELVFGRFDQHSAEIKEIGRKTFNSDFRRNVRAELSFAAYAEDLKILILCYADGKIIAIMRPLDAEIAVAEPEILAVEGIAGVSSTVDTVQLLTIDGKALAYQRSGDSAVGLDVIAEKSIMCDKAFLVSKSLWVVETRVGAVREISTIQDGRARQLMKQDGISLLGADGSESVFLISYDIENVIQKRRIKDGDLVDTIRWKDIPIRAELVKE